jgi:hypothetical protein
MQDMASPAYQIWYNIFLSRQINTSWLISRTKSWYHMVDYFRVFLGVEIQWKNITQLLLYTPIRACLEAQFSTQNNCKLQALKVLQPISKNDVWMDSEATKIYSRIESKLVKK